MGFSDKFILGVWNVGIIEKSAEELLSGEDYKIRWVKHSYRDRFFADPFLLDTDQDFYYILAEEMPFYSFLGRIVKLKINKNTMKLAERSVLIESEVHLSYPFVYKDKIIPEAYRGGSCIAYDKETLEKEEIISHGLIDQTFLEYDGKQWIFATDGDNQLCGLKIFYKDFNDNTWHEHSKNPVKQDIKTSRPGGHFFKIGDNLYRPVQDSEKLYGERIRIMRVDKLTVDEFEETEVKEFSSKGFPPYDLGFHTFNAEDGFTVVDGYKEYKSFFIKPLCLKFKKLMTFIGERKH